MNELYISRTELLLFQFDTAKTVKTDTKDPLLAKKMVPTNSFLGPASGQNTALRPQATDDDENEITKYSAFILRHDLETMLISNIYETNAAIVGVLYLNYWLISH